MYVCCVRHVGPLEYPPPTGVLSDITPHGVMKLRTIFNDSVLDVLYYMSPKYGPEVHVHTGVDWLDILKLRRLYLVQGFAQIYIYHRIALTFGQIDLKCPLTDWLLYTCA